MFEAPRETSFGVLPLGGSGGQIVTSECGPAKAGTPNGCVFTALNVSPSEGLLQDAVFDVQLPIATGGETRVVRHHKKRLFPVARKIQQKVHDFIACF